MAKKIVREGAMIGEKRLPPGDGDGNGGDGGRRTHQGGSADHVWNPGKSSLKPIELDVRTYFFGLVGFGVDSVGTDGNIYNRRFSSFF